MKTDYDALLVVSFGGPEGMDDVIPFLENVLRGRNVPRERMVSACGAWMLSVAPVVFNSAYKPSSASVI